MAAMADNNYLSEVLGLIKLTELSDEREKPRTKKLMKALLYDRDPELLGDLSEFYAMRATPQLIEPDPFWPHPKPGEVHGEIELGTVIPTLSRFGLTRNQLTRHVLIVGATGKGKSNEITLLIVLLDTHGIPFMVIDVAKYKYRNLIRKHPDIQVIRSRDLRLNPLKGPAITRPGIWLGDFVEFFSKGMDLLMRSRSYLVESLHKAYEFFNVYESAMEFPALNDLLFIIEERMKRPGHRNDDFLLRIFQRIQMILILTGDMMNCSSGFALEKLREREVVIELVDQNEDVKNFITNLIFAFNLRSSISQGVSSGLKHVMVFDEAKRIFDANLEKNPHLGIPIVDLMVSYQREYGEGLILADQEATKITDSIKANSNCKMCFFVSGKEIDEVTRMFNLTEPQKEVLMNLPTGVEIVKMDERYTRPFLVQVDHHPISDEVSDAEVEEHSRKFIEYLNEDVRPRSTVLLKKKEERKLSKEGEDWLVHMARLPFLNQDERTQALGLSKHMANKAAKELEYKGYARKARIHTGKPGHPMVLMDFTDKGEAHLNSMGVGIQRKGKGGIRHQFWQEKVGELWKRGDNHVIVEPNIEEANCDVLVIRSNGKRTAIEIALSHENQVRNITRDLEYFDDVIVATETKLLLMRIESEAKKNMDEENLKRVEFCLLGECFS